MTWLEPTRPSLRSPSAPVAAEPPRAVELAVLVAANLTATVTRYVAMRTWVFARGRSLSAQLITTTERRTA
jgi:hypothetical protein